MNRGKDLFENNIIDIYEFPDEKRQKMMKEALYRINAGKDQFDEKIEFVGKKQKAELDIDDIKMLKEIYSELLDDSQSSLAAAMSICSFVVSVVAVLVSIVSIVFAFCGNDSNVSSDGLVWVAGLISILLIAIAIYSIRRLSLISKIVKENQYFRNQKIYYIMLEHDMKKENKNDNNSRV